MHTHAPVIYTCYFSSLALQLHIASFKTVHSLMHQQTGWFIRLFEKLQRRSVWLSVCLSLCLSACVSAYPSVCPLVRPPVCSYACLSICLSVCLSICLFVCLSIHLPVCPSVYPSGCLSVCPHESPERPNRDRHGPPGPSPEQLYQ